MRSINILQIFEGRVAGLLEDVQEPAPVTGLKCFGFRSCTLCFTHEVNCSEGGPVTGSFSDLVYSRDDIFIRNFSQNVLAENCGSGLHFRRNRCIVRSKIRMAALGIRDAERVAHRLETEIDTLDNRFGRILEVYIAQASYAAGHLIHQAARLAHIYIFGELADLCDFRLLYRTFIIES